MKMLNAEEVQGLDYLAFIDECWGMDMTYQDYCNNAQFHGRDPVSELEYKRRYASNDAHTLAKRMLEQVMVTSYDVRT